MAQVITAEMERESLRAALRVLERFEEWRDHYGSVHTDSPFQYKPSICPGCRLAILRTMVKERS